MPRIAKEASDETAPVAAGMEGPRSRSMGPRTYSDRSRLRAQPSPLSRGLRYKCGYCDRTSQDLSRWSKDIEDRQESSEAPTGHTICPDCYQDHVKPEVTRIYEYLHGSTGKRQDRAGDLPFELARWPGHWEK